jgi:hypothetical protein
MRVAKIVLSLVSMLVLLTTTFSASAYAETVRTFDAEPTGAPPSGTRTYGDVLVEDVTAGSSTTRAVHLEDRSTTLQTRALFLNDSQAAKHFEFDLLVRDATEATIVAVHGNSAPEATGAWRFMFARESAGSTTAIASVYNGSAWVQLARVPGLLDPNTWQHLSIDASPATIVLTAGGNRYKTSVQAAKPTQITSLEFASAGTAAVGQSAYVDNLRIEPMAADDVRLHGMVLDVEPGRIVRSQPQNDVKVATFGAPAGLTGSQFQAAVQADSGWTAGRVTGPDANGILTVYGSFTADSPGSRPLSVRVTTPFGVTTVTTGWVPVDQFGLVAADPAGTEIRFPDVVKLADGRLLAVYHSAAAHTNANGKIKQVVSSDLGRTWSAPSVAVSNAYDNRDPKLAQLADGTILLSFFQTQWVNGQQTNRGVFVARQAPGASGFSAPVQVGSAGAAYSHGPAVELANGDVVLPLYGGGARLARSTDGGRTFAASAEVFVARDSAQRTYQEPNLTRLASGELIMVIRTVDKADDNRVVNATISRSSGAGTSWTPLESTAYPASSHHQLLTSDQRVLLTYGDATKTHRPTWGTMITNPRAPWTGYKAVELYDAGVDDQANPSSAEIAPGRYLTLTYNVNARSLVGRYSTDATFR